MAGNDGPHAGPARVCILGISPKTAGAHTYNLMAKLDVHNRAGVVRWALDNGLVPLS